MPRIGPGAGGFAPGSARQNDWSSSRIAHDLDAVVVAVDYRPAPAHPFPAAVEDCHATLRWVASHGGQLGADPTRLAVIGDSTGGNLAAVIRAQRAALDRGPSGHA